MKFFFYFLLVATGVAGAAGSDWPTYRADASRSGVTEERLELPMRSAWTHYPLHPPRPAWRGPAKRDPYNKVNDLKNRQLFDHAFHVVADARSVYFGSSADDQLHCLDATNGKGRWSYFTEGPVRLAPTLHDGKLFFGSDDGHAYCLNTKGGLVWRRRLAPEPHRIAGNNRIISAWPVRTGVLVRDGVAYAGAGMFPSEGVHLVAFSAEDGTERWRSTQTDLPAQGYLLLSEERVYAPAGRNNPVVFNRADGKRLRVMKGGGGTYALLAGDTFVFGPGRKGNLALSSSAGTDVFASFVGNHMIVSAEKSYLHSDLELSALDRTRYLELEGERKQVSALRQQLGKQLAKLRKENSPDWPKAQEKLIAAGRRLDEINADMKACVLWRVECGQPHALILAGDTLLAGGDDEVVAYSTNDGKQEWRAKVNGSALGLAVAHGRLFVSTHTGSIHCFIEK